MKYLKRVYVDMVGDLFHRGHLEFLKKSKEIDRNTYLIVGVHSDEECIRYKRQPIFCMNDRVEIIKSCKYVDEVILSAPLEVTRQFLKKHKIDMVVHGSDMNENIKELCYKVPIKMGIMKIVPYYDKISTTKIIKRIKENDK